MTMKNIGMLSLRSCWIILAAFMVANCVLDGSWFTAVVEATAGADVRPLKIKNLVIMYTDVAGSSCRNPVLPDILTLCKTAHVKVDVFDKNNVLEALRSMDEARYVQRIQFDFKDPDNKTHHLIEDTVDEFMTPRPWWLVLSQGRNFRIQQASSSFFHVILLRQAQWENELRLLAAIQFAPQEICSQTPLLMGHMVDAGWGSQALMYGIVTSDDLYKVFSIWDSAFNRRNGSTYYVNANECPTVVNKRLCVFLPLTNCSLPRAITERVYAGEKVRLWREDLQYYTNASLSGLPMKKEGGDAPYWAKPTLSYHKQLVESLQVDEKGDWPEAVPSPIILGADGKHITLAADRRFRQNKFGNPLTKRILFSQAFIFRANAHFRRKLFEHIAHYRKEHQFPLTLSSSNCVAIHIRRGDRVINNKGDKEQELEVARGEYCHGWKMKKDRKCYRQKPSNPSETEVIDTDECRQRLFDLGCFSYAAFGSLSLENYLTAARLLAPDATNAVVLTDDRVWLERQQLLLALQNNAMYQSWTLQTIPARYGRYEHERETENGVDYLMSIYLARQCHSFVGHFWSGFSTMLYQAMCFQRGNTVGRCPAVMDMGRVYTSAGDDIDSCFICENRVMPPKANR
jgi:hypothetical protein